jgi:hypothetical protein
MPTTPRQSRVEYPGAICHSALQEPGATTRQPAGAGDPEERTSTWAGPTNRSSQKAVQPKARRVGAGCCQPAPL